MTNDLPRVDIACDAAQQVTILDKKCEALSSSIKRLYNVAKALNLKPPQFEDYCVERGYEAVVSWNQRKFRCSAHASEAKVARQKAAMALLEVLHAVIGTNIKQINVPASNPQLNSGDERVEFRRRHNNSTVTDKRERKGSRRLSRSPLPRPPHREGFEKEHSNRVRNGRWDGVRNQRHISERSQEQRPTSSNRRRSYRTYSQSPSTRLARNRGGFQGGPSKKKGPSRRYSSSPVQRRVPVSTSLAPASEIENIGTNKDESSAAIESRRDKNMGQQKSGPVHDEVTRNQGRVAKGKPGTCSSPKAWSRNKKHTCKCRICGRTWISGGRASPQMIRNQSPNTKGNKSLTPTKRRNSPFSNIGSPSKKGTSVGANKKKMANDEVHQSISRGAWELRGQLPVGCKALEKMFPAFRCASTKREVPKKEPKKEELLEEESAPTRHTGWALRYHVVEAPLNDSSGSTKSASPTRTGEANVDTVAVVDVMDGEQLETRGSPVTPSSARPKEENRSSENE